MGKGSADGFRMVCIQAVVAFKRLFPTPNLCMCHRYDLRNDASQSQLNLQSRVGCKQYNLDKIRIMQLFAAP